MNLFILLQAANPVIEMADQAARIVLFKSEISVGNDDRHVLSWRNSICRRIFQ